MAAAAAATARARQWNKKHSMHSRIFSAYKECIYGMAAWEFVQDVQLQRKPEMRK